MGCREGGAVMKFSVASLSSTRTTGSIFCLLNAVLALLLSNGAQAAVDPGVSQKLATASVPFVPNAGQWDKQAAFAAQTFAGTLFVTTEGKLVYSLPGKPIADKADDTSTGSLARRPHDHQRATERTPGWVLTETFVGANGQTIRATPNGYRPTAAKVSYFIGNDDHQHQRVLNTFEGVNLGDVFPGINVQLRATGTNVEKIFTVAPRRDPRQIQLHVGGATKLELGQQGELVAHTDNGPLTYTAPIAFQEDGQGNRQPVAVRYALDTQTNDYGFALAHYDTTRPLVIDPLLQSTYLGAAGEDHANATAIHPASGEVYVTGQTTSSGTTFPGVSGGAQGSHGGGTWDIFVSRFNADLTTLIQSSYLGAAAQDIALALAIHPVSGDVYVAGNTLSSGTTFPGVSGGAQGNYGGSLDAFVSRFNADLTTLIKSSYLGGVGSDAAQALAIHPLSGDVYVAGYTQSLTFPGVSGGAQGSIGGGYDAFVSRFSADLTTLLRSSYLGAAGFDYADAMAIHPASGEVYVAGHTTSSGTTFPGVSGGAQGSYGGGTLDAFVSRFSADLTTLIRSSYLGAAGVDQPHALAIHPISGDVYVAGETDSATNTFPGVSGGAQGSSGGGTDGTVSRFSADLTTLIRSSYLGAAGTDIAYALAIHPVSGEVYVAGKTNSPNATFPGVSGGTQGSYSGGGNDAFLSRFTADLITLVQSSYLGAAGAEGANALAIDPRSGNVYAAGLTNSPTTTFPGVSGGAQGSYGGGFFNAFVSRFSLDLLATDVYPNAVHFTAQSGVPMNVVRTSAPVQISGLGVPAMVTASGSLGSAFCISAGNDCSCDATPGAAFTTTPASIANNQFLCAQHVSAPIPNALRETVVIVGGGAAKFQTFTGTNLTVCSLDVDGNGADDALTDGLIIIRALFGLTGTAVTNGAIGAGAARTAWAQLQPYLNANCGTNFAP